MKKIYSIVFVGICALGLYSCNKEVEQPAKTGRTIYFNAVTSAPTKATLVDESDDANLFFRGGWDENDVLAVCAEGCVITAQWDKDANVFAGDDEFSIVSGESNVMAYFPYPNTGGDENDLTFPFGSERNQVGNLYNSSYDIMLSEPFSVGDEEDHVTVNMKRATAFQYFHVTSAEDAAWANEKIKSATLTADGNISANYVMFVDGELMADNESNTIVLHFDEANAPTLKDAELWFNVLPGTVTSLTLKIETEHYVYEKTNPTITASTPCVYKAGSMAYAKMSPTFTGKEDDVQIVPDGTVLWSEDFGSTKGSSSVPSADLSSFTGFNTTVWGGYSVSYSSQNTVKVYFEEVSDSNLSLGETNELLIGKKSAANKNDGGVWTISGIPTGNASSATLTFRTKLKTASNLEFTSSTDGVSINDIRIEQIEESTIYQWFVIFALPSVKSFDLSISNKTTSNGRFDDVELCAGAPAPKPVINIAGGVKNVNFAVGSTLTRNFNVSVDNPFDENGVSVTSSADWLDASVVGGVLTLVADTPVFDTRNATITLSATNAKDYLISVTQVGAGLLNPDFTVGANDNNDGFVVSWSEVDNASGYDCFYSTSSNASSGTSLEFISNDGQCTASVSGLSLGTYYVYVKTLAQSPYIASSDYTKKSVTLTESILGTVLTYTMQATKNTSNTAYATYYDVKINNISWHAPGNQNFDGYWRIGGKSLTSVSRILYSNVSLAYNIHKVTINTRGISNSNLAVEATRLYVFKNKITGNNIPSETPIAYFEDSSAWSAGQSKTITFTKGDNTSWKDCYFLVEFVLSNKTTSNYGVDLESIQFFQ